MTDVSKVFDHSNYHLLLEKLQMHGLPSHIVFLLDITQRVKIRNEYFHSCHPNGGYVKEHCLDIMFPDLHK